MPDSADIETLTEGDAAAELERLAGAMAQAERLYFRDDAPTLTDADYDALKRRNLAIEARFPNLVRPDSPSRRVGAAPSEQFSPVEHGVPMLSLDNAFNDQEVAEFAARIRRFLRIDPAEAIAFTAEPKIDGLSANLRYEKGVLVQGATRGDGRVGEDITANLRTLGDIPHKLAGAGWPEVIEVRGEVYMELAAFAAMNAEAEARGERTYVNPRNSAAGSLRQIDPAVTAKRPLRFFAYAWGLANAPFAQTQEQALEAFEAWGFRVNPLSRRVDNAECLAAVYVAFANNRAGLGYDIDGVVYKVDRLDWQGRLGSVGRIPNWAIAHKFPPEQATTTLEGIDIQVGRTGALTPVARLKPVFVGGVTVSNVTLHNADEIVRKDVRIGDTVIVQRAGDVIPQIAGVIMDEAHFGRSRYEFPRVCPQPCTLKTSVVQETTAAGVPTVVRRCTGELACPFQKIEHLKHFVSRKAFDIEGLGEKQLKSLHDDGLIDEPADIFTLEARDKKSLKKLKDRDRSGDLSIQNLFNAIQRRSTVSLGRFIYSLGVRHVGEEISRLIAINFVSAFQFFQGIEELINVGLQRRWRLLQAVTEILGIDVGSLSTEQIWQESDRLLSALVKERQGYRRLERVNKIGPILARKILFDAWTGDISGRTKIPKSRWSYFIQMYGSDAEIEKALERYVHRTRDVWTNILNDLFKLSDISDDEIIRISIEVQNQVELYEVEIRGVIPDQKVGFVAQSSLAEFFIDKANARVVNNLKEEIEIIDAERPKTDTPIVGKTIVFTGTLENLSRAEAKAQAERLGAIVASSVSKKTDIVVAGPGAGSKLKLAAELGLLVMNEDEWLAFIG